MDGRISIRAQTKVVKQAKPALPWPLERAQLIRRHEDARRHSETHCRQAVQSARQNGYREGQDDIAKTVLEDGEFRKHFVRGVAGELSHAAGSSIGQWMQREIDPMLARRKRITDAIIASARINARFAETSVNEDRNLIVSVLFPSRDFHFAEPISRR